jgi:predicted nucleic acid-binding protein
MSSTRSVAIVFQDPEIPRRIEGRSIFLLDTNVWIDLAEPKTDQVLRLQERLRELVMRAKLFCPLTYTTISEILLMEYASAIKLAAQMNDLSLSIAFAPTETILVREVDAAFWAVCHGAHQALGASEIFVPVTGFLSDAELSFPTSRFGEEEQRRMADSISREMRQLSVVGLIEMFRDSLPMERERAPDYAATALRRRQFTHGNKELARKVEEEWILQTFITARLRALQERIPTSAQVEPEQLLELTPSIRHDIDVMTIVGNDPNRIDKSQDFYDFELLRAPFVYSDVLVTRDKRIRHIVTSELRSDIAKSTKCLGTYDSLELYLESLA